VRHLAHAGDGLGLRAVGAEAEAPHAVARFSVERGVVELPERERDVQVALRSAPEHRAEVDALRRIGAEYAPVERTVERPQQAGSGRRRGAHVDQHHLGEVGARELLESLHDPARLQPRIGIHADAQPPRQRAVGEG
jgi:hypothetical protein